MATGTREKELRLDVTGMTCGSCVQRVEKTLLKQPGVLECKVNLATAEATVRLSEDAAPPPAHIVRLDPAAATLHFRGFSRPVIDPERRRPESFEYATVSPVSMWNPTPGFYTRYGDVTPLVARTDDRDVIMGSGDELQLRFDAGSLPPLPAGWTRDFLLFVAGWAKDADANTAFSQSVEPLPFHGMSQYPYPQRKRFPDSDMQRLYTARPALRLLRPLVANGH